MNIETKFSLGQEIFYTDGKQIVIGMIPCKTCCGEGTLELTKGGRIQCTSCWGRKGEQVVVWGREPNPIPSTIGKIQAEVYQKQSKDNKNKTYYMLKSTGIGSGTCHYEDEVFGTYAECKVYCDAYNEVKKADGMAEFTKKASA